MEKYYVTKAEHQDMGFAQELEMQHSKSKNYKQILVSHSMPKIPIGTKVKAYDSKVLFTITKAYSYKANNMRYVELPMRPITDYGIEKFWNELGCFDRIRLHADIKQALMQRGIVPAWNRNTNMRLFLTTAFDTKVL